MKKALTQEELEKRMEAINKLEPEEPTADDLAAFEAAEAEGYDTAIDYEEFKKSLEEYSGKLVIRIPRSLHKKLKEDAEIEGVSLNQFMLYKLAK